MEQLQIKFLLANLGAQITCDLSQARQRAEQLVTLKFGVADAAHIAFAETSADVFIT